MNCLNSCWFPLPRANAPAAADAVVWLVLWGAVNAVVLVRLADQSLKRWRSFSLNSSDSILYLTDRSVRRRWVRRCWNRRRVLSRRASRRCWRGWTPEGTSCVRSCRSASPCSYPQGQRPSVVDADRPRSQPRLSTTQQPLHNATHFHTVKHLNNSLPNNIKELNAKQFRLFLR